MVEYKITQISQKPPRTWSFKDKRTGADISMETYKVLLEGYDEAVDLNRKSGNPPKVAEMLTGTLENSDFGKRFKAERKPGTAFTPKDQATIKAQWAIGQAISLFTTGKDVDMSNIEENATGFFLMVDRVKESKSANTTPTFSDGSPVSEPVGEIAGDETIKIEDIPFDF